MKIRITTNDRAPVHRLGDEIDLDDATATRWCQAGYAEPVIEDEPDPEAKPAKVRTKAKVADGGAPSPAPAE